MIANLLAILLGPPFSTEFPIIKNSIIPDSLTQVTSLSSKVELSSFYSTELNMST